MSLLAISEGRTSGPLQPIPRWPHAGWLNVLLAIVVFHWIEHLSQAAQIWILHWDRVDALGLIGLVFPSLVRTEVLHFGYATVMLTGLIALVPAVRPIARTWWWIAVAVQVWHFFEHLLLQLQYITGWRLTDANAPTSVIQLFFPRVELHILYNLLVIVPMMLALSLHWFPPEEHDAALMPDPAGAS